MFARIVQRGQRNGDRLLVRSAGKPLRPGLRGHRLQLLDGGGTVHVARHRQHLLPALFDQVLGQLGCRRRLASALQTRHQDDRRGLCRQIDVADPLAHRRDQFLVDNTHQRLPGRQRAQHVLAQRFFPHPGDEISHHRQRHVGLEQRQTNFAQHVRDIALGDACLAPNFFDEARQLVGENGGHRGYRVEHSRNRIQAGIGKMQRAKL